MAGSGSAVVSAMVVVGWTVPHDLRNICRSVPTPWARTVVVVAISIVHVACVQELPPAAARARVTVSTRNGAKAWRPPSFAAAHAGNDAHRASWSGMEAGPGCRRVASVGGLGRGCWTPLGLPAERISPRVGPPVATAFAR